MTANDAFLVRAREDRDIDAITEIYGHHVLEGASSWELSPPDTAEMQRRADAITAAGYPYLVAARGTQILGYAYASAYRPRPAYRFTVEHSVYVDDAARRLGVGKALLSRLIEDCTAAGFRQMIAIVGDSQNLQSIEFHEKMGFERVGIVRDIGFKFDRWMDQVILQRPLGAGGGTPPESA